MNILFPTDFSENSKVALKYAADLVNKMNAKLNIVHIYDVPQMEDVGMGGISNLAGAGKRLQEKVEADVIESSNNKLKEFVNSCDLNHEHYTLEAIDGSIRIQMDRLLSEEDFDLVIMATHNETSKKGLFFGGIAQHLIESANCPVFAVPPTASYDDIKKIVYPTDLAHNENEALNWVINFARPFKASVHLLHIGDRNDTTEELSRDIVMALPYDNISYDIVPGTEISNVIIEMAEKKGADIVAMTTFTTSIFDKLFHASHAKDVLDKVNMPFLGFSKNTKF